METLEQTRRRLIKVLLDLRWQQLMDQSTLYTVSSFSFKTLPQYVKIKAQIPKEEKKTKKKKKKSDPDSSEDVPNKVFKDFLAENLVDIDSFKE